MINDFTCPDLFLPFCPGDFHFIPCEGCSFIDFFIQGNWGLVQAFVHDLHIGFMPFMTAIQEQVAICQAHNPVVSVTLGPVFRPGNSLQLL